MSPPRRAATRVLLLALNCTALPVAGQARDSIPLPSAPSGGPGVRVELRVGGAALTNFFQTPRGEPGKDVLAGTSELWMSVPLGGGRAALHGSVAGTFYSEFDPSYALLAGARWGGRVHRVEGTAAVRAHSPRVEVGDTLGFADVWFASASYAIRPVRAVELRALTELDRQSYGRSRERDNQAHQVGVTARYLGLGSMLSPEIGAAAGSRDVKLESEDHDERAIWVTLRAVPAPAFYFSLRYRGRWREYTSRDPASRNLGREDDRRDLTLTVDISLSDRWSWIAYLSHQEADSTNKTRTFRAQYLLSSLSYRLR